MVEQLGGRELVCQRSGKLLDSWMSSRCVTCFAPSQIGVLEAAIECI